MPELFVWQAAAMRTAVLWFVLPGLAGAGFVALFLFETWWWVRALVTAFLLTGMLATGIYQYFQNYARRARYLAAFFFLFNGSAVLSKVALGLNFDGKLLWAPKDDLAAISGGGQVRITAHPAVECALAAVALAMLWFGYKILISLPIPSGAG